MGSPVPGIFQARTLEWVAISFSNAWKWKVKVNSVVSDSSRPHGLQPTSLLGPWDFPGKSTGVECHCLLRGSVLTPCKCRVAYVCSVVSNCLRPHGHRISLARILVWVPISYSRRSSQPKDWTCDSSTGRQLFLFLFFPTAPPGKPQMRR